MRPTRPYDSEQHTRNNDRVLLVTLQQAPRVFLRLVSEATPSERQTLIDRLRNAGASQEEIRLAGL